MDHERRGGHAAAPHVHRQKKSGRSTTLLTRSHVCPGSSSGAPRRQKSPAREAAQGHWGVYSSVWASHPSACVVRVEEVWWAGKEAVGGVMRPCVLYWRGVAAHAQGGDDLAALVANFCVGLISCFICKLCVGFSLLTVCVCITRGMSVCERHHKMHGDDDEDNVVQQQQTHTQ